MTKKIFAIGLLLGAIAGCNRLKFEEDADVIATVGDQKLRKQEVVQMIKNPLTAEDSVAFIADYAERWIKRELKKRNAEENFVDRNIEKMVEEYRQSLLTYKYEQQYTSQVDDRVSEEEILAFYRENQDNFLLAAPMVKARILLLPVDYRNFRSLSKKFYSNNANDVVDVGIIAAKEELPVHDFYRNWYYFDEVARYIPIARQDDTDRFIRENRKYEVRNQDHIYLMNIYDYKQTGSVMPLDFVREQIKRAIINNRKVKYLNRIEDSLYRRAILTEEASNKYRTIQDTTKYE